MNLNSIMNRIPTSAIEEYEPYKNNQASKAFQDYQKTTKSLNDFRNKITKYFQYDDMREQMIDYFKGTSDDIWFIQEISNNLHNILLYNTGAIFINEICKKLAFTIPEWNDYIIQNIELVLSSDDGPNIFLTLFSSMDDFQKTELSNTFFLNFAKWSDSNFKINQHSNIRNTSYHQQLVQILFKKLVIFCREQEQYFKPLLLIDYFTNPKYLFILFLLIKETNYSGAIKIILDNFDYCAKNSDFTGIIIYLYTHKEKSIKQAIFDQLISNHKQNFLKDPQYKIFRAISIDGILNHRETIANILEKNLNLKDYPSFFEQFLVSIIMSLPLNSRMEFLRRNQNELLRFTTFPTFSLILQYQEVL